MARPSRVMETADKMAPAWIGFGIRALPLPVADRALRHVMERIVRGHPGPFGRIAPYASTVFLIEPTDLPIQFRVRLDSPAPITCQRRPSPCVWDARIAGPIAALLALAHGTCDGDALFFSREIVIEGDTDAILALRNAIDDAEIDLLHEMAGLVGPFSPAARRLVQAARPVARRLRDIAMPAWKVKAT